MNYKLQQNCTFNQNTYDGFLYSKIGGNNSNNNDTVNTTCKDEGCIYCKENRDFCEICNPFTFQNEHSGECECQFNYLQYVLEDPENRDYENAILFVAMNLWIDLEVTLN